ncbi:ABC transporter substrate-binding protein [Galbitalea sp. SE-J8]|uniref:ABC transporter substrate-binding protein n=1 Tax=Galbitalea sp. SE-J8 TaxID=3054952 RepID=UPI00259D26D1|nr:ABC transporter substrate-binding protein [Galbitalea sp. SE-J8]MDM4762123.1 ABC transporter substrate-binding protein [Galbitalea sp. SE-J8]
MRTRTAARGAAAIGLTLVATLALAACNAVDTTGADGGSSAPSAAADGVDLSSVCPANVVIQTDWNPESEHGHLYELLGDDYTVDAANATVSGPLMSGGKPTGVNVEIRSGGPAIGYQTVTSQMYADTSITLGYVTTDEAVQLSDQFPTTAVFAPLDKSPIMIMWDPKTYPDVTDIKSLGTALESSGGVIRYFGGSAYMSYLIGAGVLDEKVTDGSYDGTPANFVANKGKDAQQGFASAEPYLYKNSLDGASFDVKYQLVNDTGYPIYASAMSVRSADLEKLTPCLKELVPVLQQAEVDYFKDPTKANALILDLVKQYDNGWIYDQGEADYSVDTMKSVGLVGNGDNDYMGDMTDERVQKVIDDTTPIFTEQGTPPKSGLTVKDIATNEFIDTSIGF